MISHLHLYQQDNISDSSRLKKDITSIQPRQRVKWSIDHVITPLFSRCHSVNKYLFVYIFSLENQPLFQRLSQESSSFSCPFWKPLFPKSQFPIFLVYFQSFSDTDDEITFPGDSWTAFALSRAKRPFSEGTRSSPVIRNARLLPSGRIASIYFALFHPSSISAAIISSITHSAAHLQGQDS
jgi:hypothetical protein